MKLLLFLCVLPLVAWAFQQHSFGRRVLSTLNARQQVGSVSEIPKGERKVVETDAGAVVVANVDGAFYAVNAKCPHLGLPMKKVSSSCLIVMQEFNDNLAVFIYRERLRSNKGNLSLHATSTTVSSRLRMVRARRGALGCLVSPILSSSRV